MSNPKQTWLALRRPDGDLEPLVQMETQYLTHLAIEAGLLGLSLEEWLVAILRAAIETEPPSPTTPEEFMGPQRIELSIPEDLLEDLKRQQWRWWDHIVNLGESLTNWLYFVAWPGHVLSTARLQGKRRTPEQVARALIEDQLAKMELPLGDEDLLEAKERKAFEQQLEAGTFQRPLQAAGGTLAAS